MEDMMITWARCNPKAKIPTKREEDAGADIYGIFEDDIILMKVGDIKVFKTGLKFACGGNWYPQIAERGSTGFIGLSYRAGVFDSGFRNEWKIILNNTSNKEIILYNDEEYSKQESLALLHPHSNNLRNLELYSFYPMSKGIAQVVFNYVPKYNWVEIEEEDLQYFQSERGEGMLGSTQK